MKGSGRIILKLSGFTTLCVFYVHLNMSLFGLSYSIHAKSNELVEKNEYYRHLKYEVEQLRAPYRLAEQIKKHELELDLPKEVRVVQVAIPDNYEGNWLTPEEDIAPEPRRWFDFLGSWVKVAQAKTDS